MATPVIMPRQGQSVESCIIAKWHKKKGDKVNTGDILFTYETDKATFDEEAKEEGILLDVFFEEGDDVPVLTNVCVIGNEGESTAEFNPAGQEEKEEKNEKKEEGSAKPQVTEDAAAGKAALDSGTVEAVKAGDGELKISPRARNLADRTGVDYRYAAGTGPNGRIIERDVVLLKETGPVVTPAARDEYRKSAAGAVAGTGLGGRITTGDLADMAAAPAGGMQQAQAAGSDYTEVKLSNIRKVIAKAMHQSLSSTAQLTLNASFDATEILAFRKKLKENKDKLGIANITLNDMILFAVSRTILNHRDLNANFLDDRMLVFNHVHLGVAVDTERGLMVPTLFNADLKPLNEIASESKALADACQKGTINPDLLKGGTFTVTNLGTLGIESFTPVLNPPQTGILGVNTIVQRVREVNGGYENYPAMGLSLTFDHRAVDGAPAAKFLKELRKNLENFSVLLAK